MLIRVIKACKLKDRFINNQLIQDNEPIGFIMDVEGKVPESYIKYVPGRIFDKRKYSDLFNLFGKDHLPTENEIKLFQQKLLREKKIKYILDDMKEIKISKWNKIKNLIKSILLFPLRLLKWILF